MALRATASEETQEEQRSGQGAATQIVWNAGECGQCGHVVQGLPGLGLGQACRGCGRRGSEQRS